MNTPLTVETPTREPGDTSGDIARRTQWSTFKRSAVACWIVAVVVSYGTWLPFGAPSMILVGLLTAAIFPLQADARGLFKAFRDWGLLLVFLVLYGTSRSIADTLGMPLQERVMIDIDVVLGLGETWIHRLQRWIDWDSTPQLWELVFPLVYLSHFVVPISVLTYLYVRDRDRWRGYMWRWTLLSFIGLIGYVLLPTVPPWLSSDYGTIELVHKGLERDWSVFHLGPLADIFRFGTDTANPVAAMPSLHCAYPALIVLFFGPNRGRVGKTLLSLYALLMGFTVVITGQHWVIDVIAGWLVAYAAHRVITWIEQRRFR